MRKGKIFFAILLCLTLVAGVPVTSFGADTFEVSQDDYYSYYYNNSSYTLVRQETRYRYRDKVYASSGYDSLSGYTLDSTEKTSTTYGSWSTTKPSSSTSNTSDVKIVVSAESRTAHRSYARLANCNYCNHGFYYKTMGGTCKHGNKTTIPLFIFSSKSLASSGYKKDKDGAYLLPKTIQVSDNYGKLGAVYIVEYDHNNVTSFTSTASTSTIYLWPDTVNPTGTVYREKIEKYVNHFSKWGDWSSWSNSYYSSSNNRQVDSKQVYILTQVSSSGDSGQSQDSSSQTHVHWFTGWDRVKDPTYSESGLEQRSCIECGKVERRTVKPLSRVSLKNAAVSGLKAMDYTGGAIKAKPVVKVNGKTLVLNTDYKISYSANTNPGTAKVKITGINGYTGAITKTFKIDVPTPKITSLKSNKKKQFTITWKKPLNKKQIDGYEFRYRTGNGKWMPKENGLLGPVEKNRKLVTTATVKNVKRGKTYVVQVRTYKKIGKKTFRSAWSPAKKVKVK